MVYNSRVVIQTIVPDTTKGTRMKTFTKAARMLLAAALCAGVLAARAAPSSCTVATAPGFIDTRDAATGGADSAILVETRSGDTKVTASDSLDTVSDFALILVVR